MMVCQEIKRGFVKKTTGQRKKHVTMMTSRERTYLANRLRILSEKWELSEHVMTNARVFPIEFIEEMLKENMRETIVEYNETQTRNGLEKRVLIRSQFAAPALLLINGVEELVLSNLCLVMEIATGKIVTVYWNKADDNHSTVSMSRYDQTLRIL